MFSFYVQLVIYLCEICDRVCLIARLVTESRSLARLNTVWYWYLYLWKKIAIDVMHMFMNYEKNYLIVTQNDFFEWIKI